MQVTIREAQPSLTLSGVLSHELHARRPELLEEHHRLSEGIKGLWVLLTAADPIKKPTHKPRGMPHLQIPQVAPSTPCPSPKSCGQMHVCTPDDEGKLGQMLVNTCRELAPIFRAGRDHKLEFQLHSWESQKDAVSIPPHAIRDQETAFGCEREQVYLMKV